MTGRVYRWPKMYLLPKARADMHYARATSLMLLSYSLHVIAAHFCGYSDVFYALLTTRFINIVVGYYVLLYSRFPQVFESI